jgi:glyoxylase-like metal-dependent hydrolase (beta-lactamase superfamily II)
MAIISLPTGVTVRSAAFAYRGGSGSDKRDFAMNAVLIRHPKGDLLIDAGFSKDVDEQVKTLPFFFRWFTSFHRLPSVSEQFNAAGYDRKNLKGIILTHAHWDHASGLADMPGAEVWVTPEERQFIQSGQAFAEVARNIKDVVYKEYSFEGGPYLGFEKSHDVYGDGSVVIVPAYGHTPGSVIVFAALPGGKRYALVGDLVWQQEGISLLEERPWLLRKFADADEAAVRENIRRMAAIAERFPEMIIVPAHDARGYETMGHL